MYLLTIEQVTTLHEIGAGALGSASKASFGFGAFVWGSVIVGRISLLSQPHPAETGLVLRERLLPLRVEL